MGIVFSLVSGWVSGWSEGYGKSLSGLYLRNPDMYDVDTWYYHRLGI